MASTGQDLNPLHRPPRLLRMTSVLDLVPVSRSTIYEWMAKGTFPRCVELGGGVVAWRESDVQAWIESRPESKQLLTGGIGGGSAKQAA